MQGRRGKTLIELMVVLTLVSGALGLSALTLTALFRTEGQLRRDREQRLITSRLAELWRADAHAAVACDVNQECRFTLADGRSIRYTIDGARVRREVIRDDKPEHRDSFPLAASAKVAFVSLDEGGRNFAVLSVRPSGEDRAYAAGVRMATIEALVNLYDQPRPMEATP